MAIVGVESERLTSAHDIVVAVGNEEVPCVVYRHGAGEGQLGAGGRAAIAAVAVDSRSGDGGEYTRGVIHLADDVIVAVCDEEIPGRIHGDVSRVV